MGEQPEERRATLISDALDFPDEFDSTEYWMVRCRESLAAFSFGMYHSELHCSQKQLFKDHRGSKDNNTQAMNCGTFLVW